jgi:hypothetical protein
MGAKIKDITGLKFGKWTVLEKLPKNKWNKWKCQCECGSIGFVANSDLNKGKSVQCLKCAAKKRGEEFGINLKDKRFGKWLVVERTGTTAYRRPIWKCICDCGTIGYIPSSNLLTGFSSKCGKCNIYKNIQGPTWAKILNGAKYRNLEVIITVKEASELYDIQEGTCALTGIPLIISEKHHTKLNTASLDRIDSSMGYTKENCQWVHKDVNRMKWILTNEQFKTICKQVVEYHNL